MASPNVVFALSILGLRREQEDCGGRWVTPRIGNGIEMNMIALHRSERPSVEVGACRKHGCGHRSVAVRAALTYAYVAGGIAGLVGNPGGE